MFFVDNMIIINIVSKSMILSRDIKNKAENRIK